MVIMSLVEQLTMGNNNVPFDEVDVGFNEVDVGFNEVHVGFMRLMCAFRG